MRRNTHQREAIRQAFADAGRPLSVPEALTEAQREVQTLGTATVYRAVNALVEDGFLHPVDLPGEPTRYELAGLGHHHHFKCGACGRAFDVEGCPGRLKELLPDGFELGGHEIILYGRCADCVKAGQHTA